MTLSSAMVDYINWNNYFKGNKRKAPDRLEAILTSSTQYDELKSDPIALSVIFSADVDSVKMLQRMRDIGKGDEMIAAFYGTLGYSDMAGFLGCGNGPLIAAAMVASETAQTAALANSTAMSYIYGSETASKTIAESSDCMTALAASSTARTALLSSTSAMDVMASSVTAMNSFMSDSTARTKIMASASAKSTFGANEVSAMKLVAGLSGLNPVDYDRAVDFPGNFDALKIAVTPAALNILCRCNALRSAWFESGAMDIIHVNEFNSQLGDSIQNTTYFNTLTGTSYIQFVGAAGCTDDPQSAGACWTRAYRDGSSYNTSFAISLQTGRSYAYSSDYIGWSAYMPGGHYHSKNSDSYSSYPYTPK